MNTQQIGSLENLNIDPQTTIPENVALSGDAKNVRFNRSKKVGGYVLKEVDEYVLNVIAPSLRWLQDKLETRDLEIHKLGTICDELEVEKRRLLKDLDAAHMNNMFKGAAQSNVEDKEMAAIMDQNATLKLRINELEQQVFSGGAVLNDGSIDPELIKQYEEAISAYQENEAIYQAQIAELSEQIVMLQSQDSNGNSNLEDAQKMIEELTEYAEKAQPYIEELEAKIEELQSIVAAAPTVDPEKEELLKESVREAQEEIASLRKQLENSVSAEDYETLRTYAESMISPDEHESIQNELSAVKAKLTEPNEQVEELKNELSSAKENLAELTDYAEKAQPYIESLETDLEAAKEAIQSETGNSSKISELEEQLQEAANSANEHYEHSLKLQALLDSLQSELESAGSTHAEEIASLTAQLNEASDLANQYYEYSNQLQEQISEQTAISPEATLINQRNQELSQELDELKTEHEELAKNYAELYTIYEEYEKNMPEGGIVSASEYSKLQVAFDELKDAKEEADKIARSAETELERFKNGFLSDNLTLEEFENLKKQHEETLDELNKVNMKYETLRKKRAEESAANTPDGYYSASEYETIHEQLVNATDLYNNLVDEFEGVVNENNKIKQQIEILSKQTPQQSIEENEQNLNDSGEVYRGKVLPAGIKLEDLE